ncbi:hypothetical protein [Streptomyces sp. NPDC004783]|uniref:hypothetical protein n=1 Tax=Streptomyces sp. NPDC004783 TaxID=3154459 RepID=UPI0033A8B8A2
MSPAPHSAAADRARRAGRRRGWARALVLLLALLVPCAHAQAGIPATPSAVAAAESGPGGTPAEYDHLDSAQRAPARADRRCAPPRRTHLPARAPRALRARTDGRRAPHAPPHTPRGTRSVVLRC